MTISISDVGAASSALLTPTIAVVTAYIAVQQYRMARAKKELELYDRRLRVYQNTHHIIDFVGRGNAVTLDKYGAWLDSVAEAEFLFGKEVMLLMDYLSDEVGSHMVVSDPAFIEDPDEMARVALRINGFHGVVKEVFAPYLSLRHIGGHRGRPLSNRKVVALLTPIRLEKEKDEERRPCDPSTSLGEDVPF